jgi:hypothetical protein
MSFEDLVVWKRACRLCVNVYRHLKECTDLGFKDQITRSALSIPCNIAEGYERNTNKDAIKFFYTSRGHVCGFYGNAILFGSKARKQAHSKLCNCFRNAATGQKSASENRKCGRAKYIMQKAQQANCAPKFILAWKSAVSTNKLDQVG